KSYTLSLHDALPISRMAAVWLGKRICLYDGQLEPGLALEPKLLGGIAQAYTNGFDFSRTSAGDSRSRAYPAVCRSDEKRSPLPQDRKSTRLNSSHVK